MKKKIIFVTQALWLGGIETALVNLLNHLDYKKYDVTCLITEDYQAMAEHITPQCRLLVADRQHLVSFKEQYKYKKLYNIMEEPQHASKGRKLIWKILKFSFRAIEVRLYSEYIKRQLNGESFDTAVIYSDRMAEITVRSIKAKKYLMFYHNADLGKAYHDSYGYRACEKIIAVSEAQCEKLKKLRPEFASKMVAIQNYIDVESTMKRAEEEKEAFPFEEEGIHLVSCGRLAQQKGFDIAVQVCAKLKEQGFDKIQWYILGVGPEKENLQKLIGEYNVGENFRLIGAKINPFPYMKAADLYVQPSRTEGYSLSILEARVLACPTVATYAAAGEQMKDGITGTLCETSVEELTNAIKKHLVNPEISERYRKNLSEYSFESENKKILNKIEALL